MMKPVEIADNVLERVIIHDMEYAPNITDVVY
jgi:hypothetical protein